MLILNVDINIMMLSCSYLGHSDDTAVISNLQYGTKNGKKQWVTI